MKKCLLPLFLILGLLVTKAQNPLVTHMYTADPTARCFDGKLYVYPSSDIVPPEGTDFPRFCMPGYHVFSLENGATWKDYGWLLKENDVPWSEKDTYAMWAPDCVQKNGKYYFFFPAKAKNDNAFRRIGVGVSESPTGPFKWEKSYIKGVSGIDPGVLVDGDKSYLYYGGGQDLFVAPLADDMKSITKEPIKIEGLPAGYKEAAFPLKKGDLYYLTFAHVFPEEGYTIGYATSDNPLGPYVYRGKIMDNIENGTNHHSIVNFNGQWILFYHFWHVSGFNKLRSMCADYLHFKDNGIIMKVKPTLRGIGIPTIGDTIQIDRYNEIENAQIAFVNGDEPNGWMVTEAHTNSYVRFNKVDFGSGNANKMQARMASGQRVGRVEVRLDKLNGPLVAEFPIEFTGGWSDWKTYVVNLNRKISGVHDLYVSFKAESGNTKTVNLNWLLLE